MSLGKKYFILKEEVITTEKRYEVIVGILKFSLDVMDMRTPE